jgi:hypothetical protein
MAAYRNLGNSIFVGITTDTKPTPANTANGAILFEFATNYSTFTMYVNNQTAWLPATEFAETLKNKTYNTTDNTFTATSQTAGDILYNNATKFVRLGIGTANQLLRTNSGATAPEWASTLSGLTLDAASQTSLIGFDKGPSLKKRGTFWGNVHSVGGDAWASAVTNIAVGSGGVGGINLDSAGTKARYSTGATPNSLTGLRVSGTLFIRRDLNPSTTWKIANVTAATNRRLFFGYISSTGAPVSAADPLANLSGVLFGLDTGVDANWHIYQNDGSASSDSTTINNIATADTSAHYFSIRAVAASNKFQYAYGSSAPISTTTWTDISTKIPAATTSLGWTWYMENLTAASILFDVYHAQAEWDG